ncbi:bifunctional PRELI-MSF1 domain/Slowmo-Ups family [Babesia duncani]|uniref:Bifunctional PRELI-MSF1 domain/Slowmo-Ups family n=1 Tax=Babesia duncani TaxID=323732 RepID=A0AAD9PJP0_9APIC|nr:bifunctional PRELI-MSF1 domain/Slowmo-Ups family [Babesia duncani]
MVIHTTSHLFKFGWETIASALWHMYPTKAFPHVKETFMIDHRIIPEKEQLVVRRLGRVSDDLPTIAHPFIGEVIEYFVLEETVVDRKLQKLDVTVKGLTKTEYYSFLKTCTFQRDTRDTTAFKGVQEFEIMGFGPFNSTLNSLAARKIADFYSKNRDVCAMHEAIGHYINHNSNRKNTFGNTAS